MRASALTDGTVDMVVDSFSMDGTHDGEVDVAGPYLTVRETLLIQPRQRIRNHRDRQPVR